MSVEKSFSVTLKMSISEDGVFESIRILKGRSKLDEDILQKINKALQDSFVPSQPTKTAVEIGNLAEVAVMTHLQKISSMNLDFNVYDTSSMLNHGDMSIDHCGRRICVEVKDYSKPVPMKEIQKYHKSLNFEEYNAGIMIQSNACGFAREAKIRTPIDIRMENGKPSAYLTGVDNQLLYPVINVLIMQIGIDNENNIDELETKRKALLSIYEKISDLRDCIEANKKTISKMEKAVEDIAKLSMA